MRTISLNFARAKVCATTLTPLIGFKYSASVRSTAATAMMPVFEAAAGFAVGQGDKTPNEGQVMLPSVMLGPVVSSVLKQLEMERSDTETLTTLAEALSDVCSSGYSYKFDDGRRVAKLALNEAKVIRAKKSEASEPRGRQAESRWISRNGCRQ